MVLTTPAAKFHFPPDFDHQAEYEMTPKGYLCGGEVELADGRRFPVTFFDPVRLTQDLEEMGRHGEAVFIEPALVVIPEVTRERILRAIPELVRQRFFDHMRPIVAPTANGVTG
jgi:hypothetical protein